MPKQSFHGVQKNTVFRTPPPHAKVGSRFSATAKGRKKGISKKKSEAAIHKFQSGNFAKFDSVETLMADLLAEVEAPGV